MVLRRRLAFGTLVGALIALVAFAVVGLNGGEGSGALGPASQGEPSTPNLDGGARPRVVESRPAEGFALWPWIGVLVSGVVTLGSSVVVRSEVRQEKARIRHNRIQKAVVRDLKEFKRIGGGLGQNT
jgi:hypothetical protein